jgi:hypothetical protein
MGHSHLYISSPPAIKLRLTLLCVVGGGVEVDFCAV